MAMKVLMMYQFCPFPPESGAQKRMFHLLEETAKRHHVSVLTFGSPDEEKTFRSAFGARCRNIVFIHTKKPLLLRIMERLWLMATGRSSFHRGYSKDYQDSLDRLHDENVFDLIYASTTLLGYYRFPPNVPLVGDTHNVEHEILYRAFENAKNPLLKGYLYFDAKLGKRDEISDSSKFDVVLATSEKDKQTFRANLPEKELHVIPNGVDLAYFAPAETQVDPCTMVFTGLMNYYPNEHAMVYFLERVLPLIHKEEPAARLFIVGANPSKRLLRYRSDRIIITGYVKDIRPFVTKAAVSVIPIWIGGGTRLKALEAMAMKRPIVSTTIGCEGINLRNGESAFFADTPHEFAGAVLHLFRDAELCHRVTEQAYTNVVAQYGWEAIGIRLDAVFKKMIHSTTQELISLAAGQ